MNAQSNFAVFLFLGGLRSTLASVAAVDGDIYLGAEEYHNTRAGFAIRLSTSNGKLEYRYYTPTTSWSNWKTIVTA